MRRGGGFLCGLNFVKNYLLLRYTVVNTSSTRHSQATREILSRKEYGYSVGL